MFAGRPQALEAPAGSSAARESPEGLALPPRGRDLERARHRTCPPRDGGDHAAQGIAEERWRREAAERERDELRRKLYGIRRGENPHRRPTSSRAGSDPPRCPRRSAGQYGGHGGVG